MVRSSADARQIMDLGRRGVGIELGRTDGVGANADTGLVEEDLCPDEVERKPRPLLQEPASILQRRTSLPSTLSTSSPDPQGMGWWV